MDLGEKRSSRLAAREWLGSAELTTYGPAVAGEHGTWRIDYVVGASGVDDGGRIRLAYQSTSDFGTPQFDDPRAENYVSVWASRSVKLIPSFDARGSVLPWSKTITVTVAQGHLARDDRVTILLGDTLHGGSGMRAQTYPELDFALRLQIDPFATGVYEWVAEVCFPVGGGRATRLEVTAPSDVVLGEATWLQVRALDRWGNPDPEYSGLVRLAGDLPVTRLPEDYRFTAEDAGVRRFEGVRFGQPGTVVVVARDEAEGISAASNPVRCHENPPAHRLFWGDLHGQIATTRGPGALPGFFAYARDVAAVDAVAHSGNDLRITADLYRELKETAEKFYQPGRFVTFHGYEWSGNTPAGGDRNVYYLDDGPLLRSSHTQVPDKSDLETDRYPLDRLYEAHAGREDVLITPHVGGRRSNLDYHDPDLEPVIEVAARWGRFEWFAREALERGMRVGFVGGSDDHSGRPGWSPPNLAHAGAVRGGLTAFLAKELTREGIWEALRTRRCYGTSGPRIVLDVSVDGHFMGSEFAADGPPSVKVGVLGTAPIDTVEVRRGPETIRTFSAMPEPEPDEPWRVRIAWRGARNRGRSRALDWAGRLTVWGGSISAVEEYAIDNPLEGVVGWDEERVAWRSRTCGDWDGVILDLEGDEETTLDFSSPTMSFRFKLGELAAGAIEHHGSLLEQRVVARRLSRKTGPSEASVTWRDDDPPAGVNPYWVWVTQTDGELAWSSPVFVEWRS